MAILRFGAEPLTSTAAYLTSLQAIESVLARRGISLAHNSRMIGYRKALEAFRTRASDAVVGPALQAVYEVRQLIVIFEQLGSQLSDPQLKQIFSGHYSPESESSSTAARDFQFEFYIAAICKRGGFDAELAEPDVVVRWNSHVLGIAAKRIKSTKQLARRISEADEQIERSAIDGMIVVDLTKIYNPNQLFLRVHDMGRAEEILSSRVGGFVQRNADEICRSAGPRTCALLAHASVPVVLVGQEIGTITSVHVLGVCEKGDPRGEIVHDFVERFAQSISLG